MDAIDKRFQDIQGIVNQIQYEHRDLKRNMRFPWQEDDEADDETKERRLLLRERAKALRGLADRLKEAARAFEDEMPV